MTTLADVQAYIRDMTARHGFTRDPHRMMTRLTQEVGELAEVITEVTSGKLAPATLACQGEFADVIIQIAGIADVLGVDLADAFQAKAAVNASRTWDLGTEKETV